MSWATELFIYYQRRIHFIFFYMLEKFARMDDILFIISSGGMRKR